MTVHIYCDGAVRGNNKDTPDSCMGAGAILLNLADTGEVLHEREFSWTIKEEKNTNQRAELYAILYSIQCVKERYRKEAELLVVSDSEWAIRCIEGKYKASSHLDLIERIRWTMKGFRRAKLRWVRGHDRDEYNERADKLAFSAARTEMVK